MDDKFKGFPARPHLQGYVPIPNTFFDEVLPTINNMSELKILLAVFRKTYGWVKEIDHNTGQPIYKLEDEISYSQFEKLTGLSSTSVATGLTRAMNDGYLAKVKQGDYSGTTSSYRIITEDGEKPSPPPPAPKPKPKPQVKTEGKKPPVQYLQLDDSDVKTPKKFGTSLTDAMTGNGPSKFSPQKTEKESMLDELLGGGSAPEPEEKNKTPHQEFISSWYRCYLSKFSSPYGNITGKEHGHIKLILKDYPLENVIKAMEFYFNNYDKIEGVPNDYPNIAIFFSWRKKIFPASVTGNFPIGKKKRNSREFEEEKWGGNDDFFN